MLRILFISMLCVFFATCTGPDGQAKATAAGDGLEILQKSATSEEAPDGGLMITVHVEVKNNTDALKDYVQASVTFYDKAGKIVGTGMGNTTNLAAGAKRTIDAIGLNIEGSDHYEVEISDHLF